MFVTSSWRSKVLINSYGRSERPWLYFFLHKNSSGRNKRCWIWPNNICQRLSWSMQVCWALLWEAWSDKNFLGRAVQNVVFKSEKLLFISDSTQFRHEHHLWSASLCKGGVKICHSHTIKVWNFKILPFRLALYWYLDGFLEEISWKKKSRCHSKSDLRMKGQKLSNVCSPKASLSNLKYTYALCSCVCDQPRTH